MNRNELVSLLFSNLETITLLQAVTNLLVALLCAIVIYAVYFYTSKDIKPTESFAKTILIVTLSVVLIVMLIGSNLALSLGMVGALSIIRFRAAVKDSRDAAFIFFAIAIGMAAALGVYLFAFVSTLFISAAIIIFSILKIGSRSYLITVKTGEITPLVTDEIAKEVKRHYKVLSVSTKKHIAADTNTPAAVTETVYEVGLKHNADLLCKRLSQLEGVISVTAVLREDV